MTRPINHKSILGNEKGMVLAVTLMLIAVLVLLGTTAVMTVTTDLKIAANYRSSTQAFYAAEAGIEEARTRMMNNFTPTTGATGHIIDSDSANASWSVSICPTCTYTKLSSALNYTVKIEHKTNDATPPLVLYWGDDNSDGRYERTINPVSPTLLPNPNIYLVTSYGAASWANKTIQVEMTRYPPIAAPGALYVDGSLQVSGSSQIIANANSTECGPPMAGVATPLAKTSVDFGDKPGRITGAGGAGLAGIREFVNPPLDIPGMAAGLKDSANFSYSVTGDPSITGMNWGTPSSGAAPSTCNDPAGFSVSNIVYYNTNGDGVNLHNASGCGTLIVDGPLRIDGNFSWYGVILATGSLTYIGTGNKNVTGAMLSGGGVITDLIGGNAEIYYCSGAVRNATQNMPLKKLSWRDMAF